VEALEAHLAQRDRRTCQVLSEALPLLRASAWKHDGCVYAESGVSPPEKVIGHVPVDELAVEKEPHYASAETLGDLLQVAEWDVNEIAGFIEAALQYDGMPVGIPP